MTTIRKRREALGVTQQEMADALGVERSTVRKWESLENYPRPKFFKAIAAYLGCTIDELFEGENLREDGV